MLVVRFVEATSIRVGNEEYARSNGLTMLQNRHVEIAGAKLRFRFRGKSRKWHEIDVESKSIARIVRRYRELPGQDLFQYVDEAGEPHAIDSGDVNEYLREIAGDEFTVKDFRTWGRGAARGGLSRDRARDWKWGAGEQGACRGGCNGRRESREHLRGVREVIRAPGGARRVGRSEAPASTLMLPDADCARGRGCPRTQATLLGLRRARYIAGLPAPRMGILLATVEACARDPVHRGAHVLSLAATRDAHTAAEALSPDLGAERITIQRVTLTGGLVRTPRSDVMPRHPR